MNSSDRLPAEEKVLEVARIWHLKLKRFVFVSFISIPAVPTLRRWDAKQCWYIQSILTVADQFVDQVLQAACKNAKERGSKILEIRDIQLTLERGYNIRIPGYASDEIRTVRKIQPSSAWISKMSAVQAAKVTGGRNVD